MLLILTGCNSRKNHQEIHITTEAFSALKTPAFIFDQHQMEASLRQQVNADSGKAEADRLTRSYYLSEQHTWVWIDRYGVDERADSLLSWLNTLPEIGMSAAAFGADEITRDIQLLRNLDLEKSPRDISLLAARLEYRLTKAYLRYAVGQRFGFINPQQVFNVLDVEKRDSLNQVIKYRGLYDVAMDHPGKNYASKALDKVRHDSLGSYLQSIQPRDAFYLQLKQMLPSALTADQRKRIMVNMERCRWRRHNPIATEGKYIIVNIPAYHLYAYGGEEPLDMRVVCGNVKTKTPLLTSYIEWMEVNPQWVIPHSIVDNEVARKAGDTAYFARNRYHIFERSTNKEFPVRSVSSEMLQSGKYRVAQEGGAGNSLGRIVFRFKNNFSVFLHDTSNPGAFERSARAMSHGCVRVSKPFDLARYVLDEPDDWTLDRLRIAMGLPAETIQGIDFERDHPEVEERNKVIGYVPVKPRVPLYIIYQTLWPDMDGVVQTWPDVYGYDGVIWNNLKTYR